MKQKLELAVSLIQQVLAELSSLEIRLPPEAEKRLADKICLNCERAFWQLFVPSQSSKRKSHSNLRYVFESI